MIVTFEIDLPDGRSFTEDELEQGSEAVRGEIAAARSPYGTLSFRDPKREVEAGFYDTLEYLVVNLCLAAVPKLRAGTEVAVDYYSSPGKMRLKPEGDDVVVLEGEKERGRFPRDALIPALADCGKRYAQLMSRIHGDNPAQALRIALVNSALAGSQPENRDPS